MENINNIKNELNTKRIKDIRESILFDYIQYGEKHPEEVDDNLIKKCSRELKRRINVKERMIEKDKKKKAPKRNYIGEKRNFAQLYKCMTRTQTLAFVYVLSQHYYKVSPYNEAFNMVEESTGAYADVTVDKKELAEFIGLNPDARYLGKELSELLGDMPSHSHVKFYDMRGHLKVTDTLIPKITFNYKTITFRLSEETLRNYYGLKSDYVLMDRDDFPEMKSVYSMRMYEYLIGNSDTRGINRKTISTKTLKDLLGLPKDGKGSYMGKEGHFKRTEFEKKVLDAIVEDLNNCTRIILKRFEDGNSYLKIKEGNKVVGYYFEWKLSAKRHQIVDEKIYTRKELARYNLIDAALDRRTGISFTD